MSDVDVLVFRRRLDVFDDPLHPPRRPHFGAVGLEGSGDPDQPFPPSDQGHNLLIHLVDRDPHGGELFPVGLGGLVVCVICGHVHDSIERCSHESTSFHWVSAVLTPPAASMWTASAGPSTGKCPGEVLFIQANHGLVLSLWDAGQMQAEAATDPPGRRPVHHAEPQPGQRRRRSTAVMADAGAAGAAIVAGRQNPALGRLHRLLRRSRRLPLGGRLQPHLGGRRRGSHGLRPSRL